MPYSYDIQVDFMRDWVEILRRKLSSWGYTLDPSLSPEEISFRFFNVWRRLILPIPRNILVSREFYCPLQLQSGLCILINKIKQGIDLTPHLSKKILEADYNDDLLNDWGIYHLHLGTTLDSSGFVNRTGPVLFARFDNSNAYLISVMGHGSWHKQELVRVIHRNWPDSIRRYRLSGISLERKVSDDGIKRLRKAHVQSFVEVEPGVVYAPIGGGYATSGIGADVVKMTDYYFMRVRELEIYLKQNARKVVLHCEKNGLKLKNRLKFKMGTDFVEVNALEVNSRIWFSLGKWVCP